MNPPSALFSAMNRERKPFTYTPGGLDLSEIKSERMAKRLMRNAMNQGVPEVPIQQIQSPPMPSTPIAVPNFNCLPVQVFPTFNLPANPKSLLRTRSNPEYPKEPTKGVQSPSSFAFNNSKPSAVQTQQTSPFPSHLPSHVPQTNIVGQNRPASMYEYNIVSNSANTIPKTNYGSNGSTVPILPPICYEAEYFQTPSKSNANIPVTIPQRSKDISVSVPMINEENEKLLVQDEKIYTPLATVTIPENSTLPTPIKNDNSEQLFIEDERLCTPIVSNNSISVILSEKCEDNNHVTIPITNNNNEPLLVHDKKLYSDFEVQPINTSVPTESIPVEDEVTSDNEQREVKVVKKQVKKEQKVENGEQNGDVNVDAELVVKLPAKKSAAKTETKVEVHKTILPDGTVEEVKVTTTKTTIDGKTEIKTKTEKKIIPKEEVEEVEEEVEEEQEETSGIVQEVEDEVIEEPEVVIKKTVKETPVAENGQKETIIKEKESVETSTTKKVVIVQKEESEEEEEEEEEEESEPVVVKKSVVKPPSPKPEVKEEKTEEKDEVEENVEDDVEDKDELKEEVAQEEVTVTIKKPEPLKQDDDEEKIDEEFEEAEEEKVEQKQEKVETKVEEKKEDEESEYTEEEYESEKEEVPVKEPEPKPKEVEPKEEKPEKEAEIKQEEITKLESKPEKQDEQNESDPIPEQKIPLREPSIPLEKVEDVEIKPIGPASEVISKTHTENTEIFTNTTQKPTGPLSTQTEYSRVENIVTVNRTTKALDHSYEQMTQAGIPTVRTYFAPSRERLGTSPTPSKPYQPVYTPAPPTERRHSLLLDRLSTERQLPSSDIYQNSYQTTYNNQSYEQQRQWSQEPQSEVLNVSNVKPSKITNSQWYQQNNRENVIYNNVTPSAGIPPQAPTPAPINQLWNQPPTEQQPQPQYQSSYIDSTAQERTLTNTYQPTNYSSYAPKPTNWANDIPSVNTNQYSYINKDTTENYQKSTQQFTSSYVPPPWEQDSNYVLENTSQNYYQPQPQSNTYTPSSNQSWKPTPPPNKFTKPPPTAYIPPAPNQSFVRSASVVEPPRLPGRKTYYSEYERRYITVPESTYIPGETAKFQPQPDPSPQYYYDNNEPSEKVEHEWRKELREFTEKTSQTTEQTSVKPPWEEDNKYVKAPSSYTPTWSQTLRPRSWRERSFESEYVGSQELPKTNTLGRGRPLSSYAKAEAPAPDRARGVSVDRYNPNYYQPPIASEHPPVPTHTLTPTPAAKAYHNPNVPAYHAHPRASAEPRDHPVPIPQARLWGSDARGSPVQSRSFKYLQWITGTED
ncbi:titin-like [Plodia interpunctella]|uniref:titin-like n=1 Tax=Plodia interpunctella TaxID=58824 RepID=UPI002368E9E9|nr:titin-like [Plodia interpunctella]